MKENIDMQSDIGKELNMILHACCQAYGVGVSEVKGTSRKRNGILEARQMYCYVSHKKFEHTFSRIGGVINRDHSSALHSVKIVQNYIDTKYADTTQMLNEVTKSLLHLDRMRLVKLARQRIERRNKLNERDKRFIKSFSY